MGRKDIFAYMRQMPLNAILSVRRKKSTNTDNYRRLPLHNCKDITHKTGFHLIISVIALPNAIKQCLAECGSLGSAAMHAGKLESSSYGEGSRPHRFF